jgi:molecular chaperone DnaJ
LQALLGSEIEVDTLRGKKTLHIPKSSQYGHQVKLSGQGLPSLRSARLGDLIYVLKIVMPKKLSKDEEKLLREIAGLKGQPVDKEKPGLFGF